MRTIELPRTKFKRVDRTAAILKIYTQSMLTQGLCEAKHMSSNTKSAVDEKITGKQLQTSDEVGIVKKWIETTMGGLWGAMVHEFPPLPVKTSDVGERFFEELETKLAKALFECGLTGEEISKATTGESDNPFVLVFELIRRTALYVLRENIDQEDEKGITALDDFASHLILQGTMDISTWFESKFSALGKFLADDLPFEISKLRVVVEYTKMIFSNQNAFDTVIKATKKIQRCHQATTFAYLAPKKMAQEVTVGNLIIDGCTQLQLEATLNHYNQIRPKTGPALLARDQKSLVSVKENSKQLVLMGKQYQIIRLIDPIVDELQQGEIIEAKAESVKETREVVYLCLHLHLEIDEFLETMGKLGKVILYTGWMGVATGLLDSNSIKDDITQFYNKINEDVKRIHDFFITYKSPRRDTISRAEISSYCVKLKSKFKEAVRNIQITFDKDTIQYIKTDFIETLLDIQQLGLRRGKKYLNLENLSRAADKNPLLRKLRSPALEYQPSYSRLTFDESIPKRDISGGSARHADELKSENETLSREVAIFLAPILGVSIKTEEEKKAACSEVVELTSGETKDTESKMRPSSLSNQRIMSYKHIWNRETCELYLTKFNNEIIEDEFKQGILWCKQFQGEERLQVIKFSKKIPRSAPGELRSIPTHDVQMVMLLAGAVQFLRIEREDKKYLLNNHRLKSVG